MSTFSAKAVQHSINQLIINTINDAEKMLLNLPRDGDRVEVITSSSYDQAVNPSSSQPCKTTKDVVFDKATSKTTVSKSLTPWKLTPESLSSSCTSATSSVPEGRRPREKETKETQSQNRETSNSLAYDKAEIMPGSSLFRERETSGTMLDERFFQVQVSPLRKMEGVMIDLAVTIKMKSGGTRTVNMQIECPFFQPKRVRVDGVWHNIV
uniref:VASt domain-containing protein n=1 Tax=Angiostrongylus cantonensis TaxID=6313 RepID=A0A0K0CX02_ANGCA